MMEIFKSSPIMNRYVNMFMIFQVSVNAFELKKESLLYVLNASH